MNIIIDTNRLTVCANGEVESLPVLKALFSKSLTMVLGGSKLNQEYRRHIKFCTNILAELDRQGLITYLDADEVDDEERRIYEIEHRSDDEHILALARLSGARILYSHDENLHKDFKNTEIVPKPRGRVYKNPSHARLLE